MELNNLTTTDIDDYSDEDFSEFECEDCRINTLFIDEYYMVTDHVWKTTAKMDTEGMLCIGCLEARIGRTLNKLDFTDCPLNNGGFGPQSDRLRARMTLLV